MSNMYESGSLGDQFKPHQQGPSALPSNWNASMSAQRQSGSLLLKDGDVIEDASGHDRIKFTDDGATIIYDEAENASLTINTDKSITSAAGITATTGGITATAGGITATAGGITATAGDITATAGDIICTAGNIDVVAGTLDVQDGGTVTQSTSKSTTVVLSTYSGQITMHAAELAAGVEVTFTVTNTRIAATDVVIANHGSAGTAGSYLVQANSIASGSYKITVSNVSAGALSEAIVINVALIKGASS